MRTTITRTATDALYLTLGLLTSIVGFAVWVGGVATSLSLALFVVGLLIALGCALTIRAIADLDRHNAALVRGSVLRGRYRGPRKDGFLARLTTTLGDPQTWKDLLWLVVHSIVGFAFGVIAVSLVASVIGLAALPAWYWALPGGAELGLWTADTLWEAGASALLAIPLAAVTAVALRAMAQAESSLAAALLDG